MKIVVAGLALVLAGFSIDGAMAQTSSAYQVGVRIAQSRGAPNVDCYARVFARHAKLIETADGRRAWLAPTTAQYNDEIARRCGFDRRSAVRSAVAVQQRTGSGMASANGHRAAGAYASGLNQARQIGHPNPQCYAQVWSRYAYPVQPPAGKSGTWWRADHTPAFRAEIRSQCG